MDIREKTQENRLRRRLSTLGYSLQKTRSALVRDNYGGYRIIDPANNTVAAGERFDLNLQDVEKFVNE